MFCEKSPVCIAAGDFFYPEEDTYTRYTTLFPAKLKYSGNSFPPLPPMEAELLYESKGHQRFGQEKKLNKCSTNCSLASSGL